MHNKIHVIPLTNLARNFLKILDNTILQQKQKQ